MEERKTLREALLSMECAKEEPDIPFIDLSQESFDPKMASLLSRNLARKHRVVPVKVENGVLYLAMHNPADFMAVEEVKMATGYPVMPMFATPSGVEHAIQELYGRQGVTKAIEEMKKSSVVREETSVITDYLELDDADSSGAPTIRLVNSLLDRAVAEGASDIHLEPREDELAVRMRVDGVLHQVLTVPRSLQASVISRIKVMGGMNITERRIPQDGRASIRIHNQNIDLRISTLPVIYGEKAAIRLLNQSTELLSPEGIGLAGENLNRYKKLIRERSGVILITGPTGSGKTSTLYTMLCELNREAVNIVTLEDPVEYHMEGINQVAINDKVGMTFAGGLRSVLRQDPDIIAVGEIRDGDTAAIAMRAALTGHLVLSTIHTNDAATAIDRLRDIGVEPYLIAGAINGIISQRLVRRICPFCRESYEPDAKEKELLKISESEHVTFYRGKGCPHCFGTGYRGRAGVFEVLLMNQKGRRCIMEGADRETLFEAVRDPGYISIVDDCRRLVLEGATSLEEAQNVIHSMGTQWREQRR